MAQSEIDKTIAQAVRAKVDADVLAALATDDVMATFVAAALNKPIEGRYGDRDKTFLSLLLEKTVEEQVKIVVKEEVQAQQEGIRAEVRQALNKSLGVIADSMVDGLVDNMKGNYPSVKVEFSGRD